MSSSPASGFQGAAIGPLVGFSADALTVSNRRTVGQGFEGAGTPLSRWGAGESEVSLASVQPAIRLGGAMRLNAESAPMARGMQRESAASPLPSLRVLPRTTCDLQCHRNTVIASLIRRYGESDQGNRLNSTYCQGSQRYVSFELRTLSLHTYASGVSSLVVRQKVEAPALH